MVRVLNFLCFAITAFACLGLYHVSEQTRVARVELVRTERQIVDERDAMKVLQADWERVADPAHIQVLAASRLGLADTATMEVASLELLPRRGEETPFSRSPLNNASIVVQSANPHLHLIAAHAGN